MAKFYTVNSNESLSIYYNIADHTERASFEKIKQDYSLSYDFSDQQNDHGLNYVVCTNKATEQPADADTITAQSTQSSTRSLELKSALLRSDWHVVNIMGCVNHDTLYVSHLRISLPGGYQGHGYVPSPDSTSYHQQTDKPIHAAYSINGLRNNQEDAEFYVQFRIREQDYTFKGVCDGHGGIDTSIHVAINLPRVLQTKLVELSEQPSNDLIKIKLLEAFELVQDSVNNGMCGTTITSMLTIHGPNSDSDQHFTANLGDSRSCTFYEDGSFEETVDHDPKDVIEKARLLSAQQYISDDGRVSGSLAVARAFGDNAYFDSKSSNSVTEKGYSHVPNIKLLEPSQKKIAFTILACDGFWDVQDPQAVYSTVNQMISDGVHPQVIGKYLCEQSKESRDNISIILSITPSVYPDSIVSKELSVDDISEYFEQPTGFETHHTCKLKGAKSDYDLLLHSTITYCTDFLDQVDLNYERYAIASNSHIRTTLKSFIDICPDLLTQEIVDNVRNADLRYTYDYICHHSYPNKPDQQIIQYLLKIGNKVKFAHKIFVEIEKQQLLKPSEIPQVDEIFILEVLQLCSILPQEICGPYQQERSNHIIGKISTNAPLRTAIASLKDCPGVFDDLANFNSLIDATDDQIDNAAARLHDIYCYPFDSVRRAQIQAMIDANPEDADSSYEHSSIAPKGTLHELFHDLRVQAKSDLSKLIKTKVMLEIVIQDVALAWHQLYEQTISSPPSRIYQWVVMAGANARIFVNAVLELSRKGFDLQNPNTEVCNLLTFAGPKTENLKQALIQLYTNGIDINQLEQQACETLNKADTNARYLADALIILHTAKISINNLNTKCYEALMQAGKNSSEFATALVIMKNGGIDIQQLRRPLLKSLVEASHPINFAESLVKLKSYDIKIEEPNIYNSLQEAGANTLYLADALIVLKNANVELVYLDYNVIAALSRAKQHGVNTAQVLLAFNKAGLNINHLDHKVYSVLVRPNINPQAFVQAYLFMQDKQMMYVYENVADAGDKALHVAQALYVIKSKGIALYKVNSISYTGLISSADPLLYAKQYTEIYDLIKDIIPHEMTKPDLQFHWSSTRHYPIHEFISEFLANDMHWESVNLEQLANKHGVSSEKLCVIVQRLLNYQAGSTPQASACPALPLLRLRPAISANSSDCTEPYDANADTDSRRATPRLDMQG